MDETGSDFLKVVSGWIGKKTHTSNVPSKLIDESNFVVDAMSYFVLFSTKRGTFMVLTIRPK